MPRLRARSIEWLLALLTLRHGRVADRSWLVGTLWPDSEEERGRHNLRDALMHLRKALGSESARIQSPTRDTLALDLTGAEVDVVRFDAAMRVGDEASLQSAVALHTGPLLEGCYEEWVGLERESRQQACLNALETLADAAEQRRDYAEALRLLRGAEGMDPLRDTTRRALMRVLAAAGDAPAALAAYREYRGLLREQMNIEPDPETVQLYQQIRQQARQVAQGKEEGETRGLPPSSSVSATATGLKEPDIPPPSALPHPLTALVGREREKREIGEAISRSRLVTLVGAGGVGKTRLAIEVARECASAFADGVAFITLASLTEPALLTAFVAAALGIREETPSEPHSPLHALASRLKNRCVLLVLDNCEHLVDEAAALAQGLLEQCPDLRILATSRQRLGLTGEVAWRVPSLAVPLIEHLPPESADASAAALAFPAIRLFVERAASANPEFELISRESIETVCHICRRLDGIPLAIELAAARVGSLTVEEIHGRLDQRFRLLVGGSRTALARQKTLRSLIDWSYDLLNESERALLCRLSVFSGGWNMAASEAVCVGDPITDSEIVDLLTSLADKSLVVAETSGSVVRYRLLETVRQYAQERLGSEAEGRYRRRHQDYFLSFAEAIRPKLLGSEQARWLGALEAEHDNLRHALSRAPEDAEAAEEGLRLGAALQRFWMIRGHLHEGRDRMRSLLSHPLSQRRTRARADGLNGAAGLAYYQSDLVSARALLEESLAIRRELGDLRAIAGLLSNLGNLAKQQKDYTAARTLNEESLALKRELGDRQGTATTLINLGNVAKHLGDLLSARAQFEESLALFREVGDQQGIALARVNLGIIAKTQGDMSVAGPQFDEALILVRELRDKSNTAMCLIHLGEMATERGDLDSARVLLAESMDIRLELGFRLGLVELLESYAGLAFRQGAPKRAASLRTAAERIREEMASPMSSGEREHFAREMDWARRVLDATEFEAACSAGRMMTMEQAIELTQEESNGGNNSSFTTDP
ncbi:MAG: transcriptional regulator, LuxR family [Chthonomonadaceae bacterium]|nr:transcriptional regulator, LuxR family [Chthonomonadaceae bacterium]